MRYAKSHFNFTKITKKHRDIVYTIVKQFSGVFEVSNFPWMRLNIVIQGIVNGGRRDLSSYMFI